MLMTKGSNPKIQCQYQRVLAVIDEFCVQLVTGGVANSDFFSTI
jgi:hypothetical protein